jgi:hypothetical protein
VFPPVMTVEKVSERRAAHMHRLMRVQLPRQFAQPKTIIGSRTRSARMLTMRRTSR